MNKTLSLRGTAVLLLVLGIISCVVGGIMVYKKNTYLSTDAVITKITSEYDFTTETNNYEVIVKYEVDGKSYEGNLGSYEDGFVEGKTIEIKYDPENPASISYFSSGMAIYLFIIGPVLIVGSAICFIKGKNR